MTYADFKWLLEDPASCFGALSQAPIFFYVLGNMTVNTPTSNHKKSWLQKSIYITDADAAALVLYLLRRTEVGRLGPILLHWISIYLHGQYLHATLSPQLMYPDQVVFCQGM